MAESKENKNTVKKVIYLIIGVLVLAVLPFLIFRPVKNKEVPAKNQERFTFMTNTPSAKDDQHDLKYWEETGNPQLFAKPDSEYGYSAFLNPEMNHLKPVATSMDTLPAIPGVFSPGMVALHEERSPKNLLSQVKFPLIDTTQKYQSLFVKKPAFLLEGGLVIPIAGFTQPDTNIKNLRPTLIEISKPSKTAPPVIKVIESCGDDQLDKAAMRALLFPAVANDYIKGKVRVEWLQNEDTK